MSDWMKKIMPPKPGSSGDTRVRKIPSGPSKKVRDDFIKKIQDQKKKQTPKKPGE